MRRRALACHRRLAGVACTMLVIGSGCAGRQVLRLSDAGEHEAAIARADESRRPVRDDAARALARSLVATGRFERARSTLQHDFRRGGKVKSLVALAHLEVEAGLQGIGTAHFARAMEIDLEAVQGDATACDAFVARAVARHGAGESAAADVDLRRAWTACGPPVSEVDRAERLAFWHEVEGAAAEEVSQRRALVTCAERACPPEDRREREEALEAELAVARASGIDALAAFAEQGIRITPDDVARLFDADLAGELAAVVVDDAVVLRWLSDLPTRAVVDAGDAINARVGAYARLRLARVRDDVVDAQDLTRARESWLLRASNGPGGWRALLVGGRMDEAEFALVQTLRAQRVQGDAASETDAVPTVGDSGAAQTAVSHWTGEVLVDEISMPELLALSRMLDLRGRGQLAFEIRRSVLERGMVEDLPGVRSVWRDAIEVALLEGRPWRAWAIAELGKGEARELAVRAAASQIVLRQSVCGGACARDGGLEEARRVMGDGWVDARIAVAADPKRWRTATADTGPGQCGLRGMLLADRDPLGQALWAVLGDEVSDETELQAALERAFESDPGLGCRGWLVGRAFAVRRHRVTAERMAERYGHLDEEGSSATLEAFAGIALAAGRPRQAELLIQDAAALDPDPLRLWIRAARNGLEHGAREYELHALRQQLLHTPGHAGMEVRRALLVSRLADYALPVDPADSIEAPERESVHKALEEHFDRLPPMVRWREGDAVLRDLAARGAGGPAAALRLTDVMQGSVPLSQHVDAWTELMGLDRASKLAAGEGVDEADQPLPAPLLDGRSLLAMRHAASTVDLEQALGVLSAANEADAAETLAGILAAIPAPRRRATLEVVMRGATAWREGAGGRIVDDEERLTELVLGTVENAARLETVGPSDP